MMINSTRELRNSIRVERNRPESDWGNKEVNVAGERKEAAWKIVLGAREDNGKEGCM